MILPITNEQVAECVDVIRKSFLTVADAFGFTQENAPRFTAFATTEDRLMWQLHHEHRQMYAYFVEGSIIGYYSLSVQKDGTCELNNLCVLPEHRHRGCGGALLRHAFAAAKDAGFQRMNIGIVEENTVLRQWYTSFGFVHCGIQKFDFFPFICGYMEKKLKLKC